MMHTSVSDMLRTAPKGPFLQGDGLASCIDAAFDCAQACTGCADACLGEDNVKMLERCIRLNQDCADVCTATGRMLSRQQQPDVDMVRATVLLCELACRKCADECDKHASHHEHCRVCASACRICERACQDVLASMDKVPAPVQH